MTKNPFVNALAAVAYITLVASLMFYGQDRFPREDTIFMPIGMISLFTLSAAVMGYIFLKSPLELYFENQKQLGAKLFVQTLGVFAVLVCIIFMLMYVVR